MRILQIINSLSLGGAERLIADITPLINERGYKTDVLLLNDSNTYFKKKLIDKGIKVIMLSKEGASPYNPLFILKLIKRIKQYDIVHVHLFPAQYWVALAKLVSGSKCKLVTTEHSTYNRRRKISFLAIVDRFIYSKYATIIAISEKTKENLLGYLSNNQSIRTIENGINLALFQKAKPYRRQELIPGVNEKDILVAMVGGFREAKDQDTLIKSFRLIPENYKLLLVGDGERKLTCKNITENLKLNDRVFFLGVRSDVPRILKTVDIYVMSSHWEGLCLSAVEAMASTKPVVATNVTGLKEIVEGAGLLFEVGDEKMLTKHILKLSDSLEYRKEIASICFAKSLTYDINIMVDGYIKVYKECLKEKS